jgi:hypothetical protein
LFTNRQGPLPTALERTARLPTARKFAVWRRFYALLTTRSMRAILYEFLPDGLYSWVKRASACILLPGQYPYTCPETTLTPTGVSAGAARNGAPRGGVGRDNSARRCLVCASQTQTTGIPLAAPSQHLGHLTCTSPALIIVVANVSLQPCLTGGPEGTVGHNPTRGVT